MRRKRQQTGTIFQARGTWYVRYFEDRVVKGEVGTFASPLRLLPSQLAASVRRRQSKITPGHCRSYERDERNT